LSFLVYKASKRANVESSENTLKTAQGQAGSRCRTRKCQENRWNTRTSVHSFKGASMPAPECD